MMNTLTKTLHVFRSRIAALTPAILTLMLLNVGASTGAEHGMTIGLPIWEIAKGCKRRPQIKSPTMCTLKAYKYSVGRHGLDVCGARGGVIC